MNSLIYFKNCASTNDEILHFISSKNLSEDFWGVYTFNQTHGRGQYGNTWENNPEENIAYSFAIKTKNISAPYTLLNYYTAVIIRDFLANLTQTDVKIKWPNDLILKNKKICGMLFEKKGDYWVAGIGINVLQENFVGLPKAGSIFSQTHLAFDLKTLAESLHQYVSEKLSQKFPDNILDQYNHHLYKQNEISVFEKNKTRQNGIVQSADGDGNLWVELEKDGLQKFFHKEIELLY